MSGYVFDTVMVERGKRFCFHFQSEEFPTCRGPAARAWAVSHGVGEQVLLLAVNAEYSVLRSYLAWYTREGAERNMERFLQRVKVS